MRTSVASVVLASLLLIGAGPDAVREDVRDHPECPICGMNRQQYAHSRMLIDYQEGPVGTCSIHCTGADIAVNRQKTVRGVYTADYSGKQLIPAATATLVISVEYVTVDPADRNYPAARLLLNAWAYLLAMGIFVLIYSAKARSLISATGVTLGGALLALDLLRGAGQGFGRTALYALIAGLATGQVIWAMNYMRLGGISGGLALLLGFYISTGVASRTLQGKLTRKVLVEYAAVALVGLLVLLLWGT